VVHLLQAKYGVKATKNCKGILNIGNEEIKVYWSVLMKEIA